MPESFSTGLFCVCLLCCGSLLVVGQIGYMGMTTAKPEAKAVKSDVQYIKCQVCELLAKTAYRQVKAKRDELKPGKKASTRSSLVLCTVGLIIRTCQFMISPAVQRSIAKVIPRPRLLRLPVLYNSKPLYLQSSSLAVAVLEYSNVADNLPKPFPPDAGSNIP